MFLLFSLTLTYGCSQLSGNPSEETMKGIIVAIITYSPESITSYDFEEFKITNDYQIKKDNEEFYCIAVNYKAKVSTNNIYSTKPAEYNKEGARFSFVKRGKEWYGYKGWVND